MLITGAARGIGHAIASTYSQNGWQVIAPTRSELDLSSVVAVHPQLASRTAGCAYEIRTEMKDSSAVPDGAISVCVMIHVLDHLPDTLAIMRQLSRKSKPDGRVLIVTHDERSLPARCLGKRRPAYCLQHPQLFNPQSIGELLQAAGFRMESVKWTVNYFPVGYLAQLGLYAMGLKTSLLGRLSTPLVGLRLGNMLTSASA